MGNGTYTTYTYNADGQVLDLMNYAPSGTINSDFEYTYDGRGLVTSMNTLQGQWTYTYDGDGQLTGWTVPDGSYATYKYDAMGNRVMVDQDGVTTNYTTNDMNQYTTVGGVTYTYDADGNLIREQSGSSVTTYSYDAQDQLIAVSNGADSQTFSYDALGNMVASSDNSVTTRYMIDPIGLGDMVGAYDSSGDLIAHYDYGLGLVSRVGATGQAAYYDFDATGSTSELTGVSGVVEDSYTYDPFGTVLTASGTLSNSSTSFSLIKGTALDPDLMLTGHRIYESQVGRFTSPDPLGILGRRHEPLFVRGERPDQPGGPKWSESNLECRWGWTRPRDLRARDHGDGGELRRRVRMDRTRLRCREGLRFILPAHGRRRPELRLHRHSADQSGGDGSIRDRRRRIRKGRRVTQQRL